MDPPLLIVIFDRSKVLRPTPSQGRFDGRLAENELLEGDDRSWPN
jgi:hypothetical protein